LVDAGKTAVTLGSTGLPDAKATRDIGHLIGLQASVPEHLLGVFRDLATEAGVAP
jgi:hypothetical protein